MRNKRNPWLKRSVLAVVMVIAIAAVYELTRSSLGPVHKTTPDFTLKDLSGKDWSMGEYRGKVPVILSFFATWCGPCKQEYPHLIELQKKYAAQGLQVVLITQETPAEVRPDPTASGPIKILVNAADVFNAYGVDPIPHLFFFDKSGKLVKDVEGFSEASLTDVDTALAKKG